VQDAQVQTGFSSNWTTYTLYSASTDRDAWTISYTGVIVASNPGGWNLPIWSVPVYLNKWNGSSWDYLTHSTELVNWWRTYTESGTYAFSAGTYRVSYSLVGLFFDVAESGEISNASIKNLSTELEVETVTVTNIN
jgi:hypothetical protein